MTKTIHRAGAICAATLLTGNAAAADVTATQVWDDFKAQFSAYGEDGFVIGAQESGEGTLIARDITLRSINDDATAEITFDAMSFTEQDDGTVSVDIGDSVPMTITMEDGPTINLLATSDAAQIIASGAPDAINYDISANQYVIALRDVANGDDSFEGDIAVTMNGVMASYVTTVGELRNSVYGGTIDTVAMRVDVQDPDTVGDYFTMGSEMTGLTMQGETDIPLDADFNDPATLFGNGYAASGGYVIAGGEFMFDASADGDQSSGSGTFGSSELAVDVSDTRLFYDTVLNDLLVNIRTAAFPLPIEVGIGEYGMDFEMPTAPAGQPGQVAIGFDIVGLDLNDPIWNLFDPGNVLPRAPATIQLGLTGTARALSNLMAADPMDVMMGGQVPIELETVAIDRLNIDAAGAQLTGEGAFTLDNADTETFAPFPRPEGQASVQLSGFNALLDDLIEMGLVAEQDVMGARMMVGMFARSTGDDSLQSTLEVLPNGNVNVNGNRIR